MSVLGVAATLAGGLLAIVGTAQIPARWLRHRFAETRSTLRVVRKILDDAKAVGGEFTPHYLTDEAKDADRLLEELVPDLRSRGVARAVQAVLDHYRSAFGSAPPRRPMAAIGSGPIIGGETEKDREARERQVEHAEAAISAIDLALRRMRRIERFIIGP